MARRRAEVHSLEEDHLVRISARVAKLAVVARSKSNPYRRIALAEMKWLFWRWTADAFDERANLVRFDGVKHSCEHLIHSADAMTKWDAAGRPRVLNKELRHEHAVPCGELAKIILREKMSANEVRATLQRLCHAVVLTKSENARFKTYKRRDGKSLKTRMPDDWDEPVGAIPHRRVAGASSSAAVLDVLTTNPAARYALSRPADCCRAVGGHRVQEALEAVDAETEVVLVEPHDDHPRHARLLRLAPVACEVRSATIERRTRAHDRLTS